MAKKKNGRKRICFVPGCRETITDSEESFCPKCLAKMTRAQRQAAKRREMQSA